MPRGAIQAGVARRIQRGKMRGQPKLIRRKDSPFWFIYIPPHGGRGQSRFSTCETDYGKAERVFAQFLLERKKPQLSTLEEIRIIDMLERYAEHKSQDATVQHHLKHLKPFFRNAAASQVNNQLCRDYAKQRTAARVTIGVTTGDRKVSPATVRRELDTLSAALGFAKREGYINEIPHIEKPAASPPKERYLTHDEFQKLLDAANYPLDLYLHIAINTAARPGAIYALKWFQVDLKRRVIHFNPEGRQQTRKHRPSVAINDKLYFALKDAKGASEYVLGGVKSLKKAFKSACQRAKLKGATPYTLRHTAITWAVQGGHSLANVGMVAGHKDPRTTMRYAKHDPNFTRAVTDTLASGQELAKKTAKKSKNRQKRTKKNA